MIKSLNIQNFQSHERTYLEMHGGVNIFVGASDTGKSTILRSLRWVIWNRPSGNSVRSWWGGATSVKIETEKGFVTRIKDKSDKYILELNGKKAISFEAFGTTVPQEIVAFFNISDINLQKQLDSHFLLSKSPGEVAQHFNKVAKLNKIDSGMQKVESEIRQLTATIGKEAIKDKPATGLIKQVQDAEENLKEFEYLEKAEVQLEVLEEWNKDLTNLQLRKKSLTLIQYNIQEVTAIIKNKSTILIIDKPLIQIIDWIAEANDKDDDRKNLSELLSHIDFIQQHINKQKELVKIENSVNNLVLLYKTMYEIYRNQRKFETLIVRIKRLTIESSDRQTELKVLQDKLDKITTCPFCGQQIKKNG